VDVASGSETPLSATIEPHSPDYPIAWHPVSDVIAYRDRVYEPAASAEQPLPGVAVNWSPDGRMLVVTLPDDPARGTVVGRLLIAAEGFKEVIGFEIPAPGQVLGWTIVPRWTDWAPDGRHFIYMDPTETRERVRVYDTVEIAQVPYRNIKGERPQVSPDGTALAFQDSGKVWVLAMDGTTLQALFEGSQGDWVK
jgi:hypothetical protein